MHGVTEMAEPEDLRAIFKAPRGAGGGGGAAAAAEHAGPNVVSPQSADGRPPLRPPPPPAGEGSEGGRLPPQQMQLQSPSLSAAYPVDDRQWSIPSIRLANHVESSSRHLYRGQSSGNFSEYTDEEGMSVDESYYSFLATDDDDDTASLSSRGSLQASSGERMRRFSRQFLRTMSSSATNEGSGEGGAADIGAAANAVFEPFQHPAPAFPAAAAKSNSFLERMRGRDGDVSAAVGTGRRGRRWSGYRTCRAAATRCGRSPSRRRRNSSRGTYPRSGGASRRRRRARTDSPRT